jgi:hypothetical protein
MRESFSLTHHFIVKIHMYHQGNMFRLQGAIIKPLYKNISLSGFWCTSGITIVYITGVLLYSVLIWLKMRLKWKTMFSKWSTVLKYTILSIHETLSSILTSLLTKLEHCIQQYPSNVNKWDPNLHQNQISIRSYIEA